jgi:hypothetical protein
MTQHVFVCVELPQPRLAPATCCVNVHSTVDLLDQLPRRVNTTPSCAPLPRQDQLGYGSRRRLRSDLGHNDLLDYTRKLSIIFN